MFDSLMGFEEVFKRDFGSENRKKRNFKNIRNYFDMYDRDKYTIDDQTWDDFNMDEVFAKVDRTNSSVGEAILYDMIRNPLNDKGKLNDRSNLIDNLISNEDTRSKLQLKFFRLGYDKKNTFLEMIQDSPKENKIKYYIYFVLGLVIPVTSLVLGLVLKEPKILLFLFCMIWLNLFINNSERNKVKSNGLIYLRNIINTAKGISRIKDKSIKIYVDKINDLLKDIKSIDNATGSIYFSNVAGGAFNVVAMPFLLEETAFYRMTSLLKEKEDSILELYKVLGELEAYISIASYKKALEGKYTKPIFTDEIMLKISEGVHPLVKDAVPNSIEFKKRGIVLTGTNMAGKSTFLRMIGINMVFAQCFNFTLTEKYEASFFNIVSSISPSDDVTEGKSYYMAEAESLLRIINSFKNELPVFCPIDEIFRGTNPIERVSASAEILKYINDQKSISIVATHDRELTDILKDNYEFYYFSEKVDNKGLSFDYKIKKGVSKTRNAIKLLEHIGYPNEIIKKSFVRAENLEKYM